jgi:hypothetical protein
VYRRKSDYGPIDPNFGVYSELPQLNLNGYYYYRNKNVDSWNHITLRIGYMFNENSSVHINFLNALNNKQELMKTNYYPFDYLREPRRILIESNFTF